MEEFFIGFYDNVGLSLWWLRPDVPGPAMLFLSCTGGYGAGIQIKAVHAYCLDCSGSCHRYCCRGICTGQGAAQIVRGIRSL